MSIPLRIFSAIAALVLLVVAIVTGGLAFQRVLEFRTLERIPLTTVNTSTGGEVQLRGRVEAGDSVLVSPDTQTRAVYYRYLVEEEYRDSDGNKKWRTVRDESSAADFFLRDDSGRALIDVDTSRSRIDWSVPRKFRQERGDMRYSEWRIDIGETINLFGWLQLDESPPRVRFDQDGDYLPIISSYSASKERGELGWWAVILLAVSVSALTFMCFFIACGLAIHRVILLLAMITLSTSLLLLHYGWRSLENDVGAGYQRVQTQIQRSNELLQQRFATLGIDVADSMQFDLSAPRFQSLSAADKTQLNGWHMAAAIVRERYLHQIDRFPENLFARSQGLANPSAIALPPDQQALLAEAMQSYQGTKIGRQIILTLVGFAIMAAMAWFAFIFIRVKRMQENLPTTKTSGVVYGLSEVAGKLAPEDSDSLLVGPLSSEPCTWYKYLVKEKRGAGKNAKWVTIEKDLKKQPFYCQDDTGRLRVFPSHAEVISKHKTTERRGRRRYYEWRLQPDDDLYLLGKADVDKTKGDTLVMRHAKDTPFIVSNRSEKAVMINKAAKGMALLSLSVCLMFFSLLLVAASSGEFSSLDYILTALAAPMFFIVLMVILTYNDIIFLRQRCQRAWANIQVSLKKRHDLLPRLASVLKASADHEKDLQTRLAELRTLGQRSETTTAVESYLQRENAFLDRLQITVENYPQLQTDAAFQMLHKSLVKLENEIAMIRAGFNDAVEYYNTRIQQFPDTLLAKLGRFQRLDLLAFESKVHQVPRYDTNVGDLSAL